MSEMTPLISGILKYYKKFFIMDEDALRRIQATLQKAAKEIANPTSVVFHVEREDDRFYEVTDIGDLLSDPNMRGRRIIQLVIILCCNTNRNQQSSRDRDILTRIRFSRAEKYEDRLINVNEVRLQIAGENRNWALLLADDLEPQILRTFKAKSTPRVLILGLLILFGFLIAKLAVLITKDLTITLFCVGPILFLVFVEWLLPLLRGRDVPAWITRWFGPESAFLWGEETQDYENREQIRNNIMWVVIIGFIVAFLAAGAWLVF